MNKPFSLLLILVALILPMTGCKDKEDPLEINRLESVDITYTYTVSADLLKYFNITAMYYNPTGETVSKQMTTPELVVTTSAVKFPAQRQIWFMVTRTDMPAPEYAPNWTQSISIVAIKRYTLGFPTDLTTSQNATIPLSPKPERFTQWAEKYMKDMATGYPVTIDANGNISF